MLDIVTIGRSCVDLYGEQVGGRLEDMASFAKYIGGSPTNTAIGLARLGLKPGLLTKVGNDHFGRFVREELQREGVDVTGVTTDPDRLTALAILGIRNQVDFPLIFYRENCADMALAPVDVDEALFRGTRAVLINGTHLSQPDVAGACRKACEVVRSHGGRVVFDIDYRPVLWGLAPPDMGENRFVADIEVTTRLQEVLPLCDLVVGTEEEIHILGGTTDTIAALTTIRRHCDALLVVKRGADGCVCFEGAIPETLEAGVIGPGFPVEVFNVLGAGDAFMAGFLSGWLRHAGLEECCTRGNACGALVVSRHGCAPAMPSERELDAFLAHEGLPFRLRDDEALEALHWSTTRHGDRPGLFALAMDHRSQFEALAEQHQAPRQRIEAFKELALAAVEKIARGDPAFGLLLDGRLGMRGLEAAAATAYWIGRPIEQPGSRPLRFEGHASVAVELRGWPVGQVVKCLLIAHPDDNIALRAEQEAQLRRLFDACRQTRHEFLLELIHPRDMPRDSMTTARLVEQVYAAGIRPDWWKLEPADDAASWTAISRTIEDRDPHCRGIVVLGLGTSGTALQSALRTAATNPLVRGFAVGRTIWADAADRWFAGEIDDGAAVDRMAEHLSSLVACWREARQATLPAAAE